jgi:MFS transporter, Spinster family, sphingosine-1-phosphate transporter
MRLAWLTVALLWPVALLNYLDRQMLASMKSSIMGEVPDIASEANWGWILAQFKWTYAILSPFGGYFADRFSRRWTICASLFAWSAITWATGHVTSFQGLLWTRTLMGISEAFYIPAALALITEYHIGGTRSRAVGIHQTAIYCGIILGGFAGYAADAPAIGWRFTFDLTGAAGVLYSIPLLFLLRDAAPTSSKIEDSAFGEIPSPSSAITDLIGNVSFLLLVIYFTLPAMAGWIMKDWMPALLKEWFKLGQGMAGVSAALYVNIASLIGVYLGGWLADIWMTKTNRGRIYASAIGMVLMIPALLGIGNSPTLLVAIAFLALFGLGWGFFDCNNMPILAQIVPARRRATGYGLMNLVSISCGGLVDWQFGYLRDQKTPSNLIFAGFALLALISVAIVLLIRPREEQSQPNA